MMEPLHAGVWGFFSHQETGLTKWSASERVKFCQRQAAIYVRQDGISGWRGASFVRIGYTIGFYDVKKR